MTYWCSNQSWRGCRKCTLLSSARFVVLHLLQVLESSDLIDFFSSWEVRTGGWIYSRQICILVHVSVIHACLVKWCRLFGQLAGSVRNILWQNTFADRKHSSLSARCRTDNFIYSIYNVNWQFHGWMMSSPQCRLRLKPFRGSQLLYTLYPSPPWLTPADMCDLLVPFLSPE